MGCIPGTPTYDVLTEDVSADGWIQQTSLDLTALAQYDAIGSALLTFDTMMQGVSQAGRILQVQIAEVTTGGDAVQKKDLYLHLYTTTAPTTPTANAAYSATRSNWIGTYLIRTEDYQRLSANLEIATVHIPLSGSLADGGVYFRTGSASSTAGTIYGVLVAAEAVDYAATAEIYVRLTCQAHNTLNAS